MLARAAPYAYPRFLGGSPLIPAQGPLEIGRRHHFHHFLLCHTPRLDPIYSLQIILQSETDLPAQYSPRTNRTNMSIVGSFWPELAFQSQCIACLLLQHVVHVRTSLEAA